MAMRLPAFTARQVTFQQQPEHTSCTAVLVVKTIFLCFGNLAIIVRILLRIHEVGISHDWNLLCVFVMKTTIVWLILLFCLILLFFASAQNNVYLHFCVSEILQGVARCDQMFSRFKAPLPLYPPRENPTADGESDLMVSCRQALQCSSVGFLFHALVCTSEECCPQHYCKSFGFLQFSVCTFLEIELPQMQERLKGK